MVPSRAGRIARADDQTGLLSWNGMMIQPRVGMVRLNSFGTSSLGVAMRVKKSSSVIEKIAIVTEKSLMNWRTTAGKNSAFLKSFRMTEMMYVPRNSTIDIRKTSDTYSGLSQSAPTSVPLRTVLRPLVHGFRCKRLALRWKASAVHFATGHVNRIVLPDMEHVLDRLVDEDDRDEAGKVFLGEARNVAHEGTRVDRDQNHEDDRYPGADPEAERQNSYTIVSKTSTGPVEPRMVSGWPEKNPYPMPHTNPDTSDSIAAILFPVAVPSSPPNVMIGERQAKPPKSRPVRERPASSRCRCSSSSSSTSSLGFFSGGRLRTSCEGMAAGGSIRIEGSHSPGGSTVTASRNSSMPASRCSRFFARYATSWNISSDISVAMARPISWKLPWLPGGPSRMKMNLCECDGDGPISLMRVCLMSHLQTIIYKRIPHFTSSEPEPPSPELAFRGIDTLLGLWLMCSPCVASDEWFLPMSASERISGRRLFLLPNSCWCLWRFSSASITFSRASTGSMPELTMFSHASSAICSRLVASMSSITVPFSSRLRSSNSECSESVATCGFDHRLPPSSTSSSNFTQRAVSFQAISSPSFTSSSISEKSGCDSCCPPSSPTSPPRMNCTLCAGRSDSDPALFLSPFSRLDWWCLWRRRCECRRDEPVWMVG
uniref:Uncharacterized protein n=1 Tax=Anopheles atroparvus TaxID=41427 RepID=A0A182J676_ANOAO